MLTLSIAMNIKATRQIADYAVSSDVETRATKLVIGRNPAPALPPPAKLREHRIEPVKDRSEDHLAEPLVVAH